MDERRRQKNLYREILYGLTRKLPALGDWYGAAQKISKADEISNGALKKILADVLKIYEAEKIIHWCNVNVGHGAYTSAEEKIFRVDVKEKIQSLAEHCNSCAEEIGKACGRGIRYFQTFDLLGRAETYLNINRNVDGTLISVTRPEVRKFLRNDEKVSKKIYGSWNDNLQANNSTEDDKIFLLKYLCLCSAEESFRNNFAQKFTFVKISKAVVPKLNYQSERDYLFATELLKVLCREIAPLFTENKFIKQLEATVFVVQNLAEVAKTYGGKISETVDSLKKIFKLIREKNFDLPTQFDFATMLGTMLAKTNHGAEAENYFALANEFFKQIDVTLKLGKNHDGILNKLSVIKNLIEQAVKEKNLSNYNNAA